MTPIGLARSLTLTLVPFVLSLTVHEFAHAWVANRLGDDTGKKQGRLTLNPISHIDPLGTLIIPALTVVFGGMGLIAWAKPVPYRPDRFRPGVNARLGSALVGLAGPLSNILLAALSVAAMAAFMRTPIPIFESVDEEASPYSLTPLGLLLWMMFEKNVALAVFNLLPIPPLDGHHLIPPFLDRVMRPVAKYGFLALLLVMCFKPGILRFVMEPPMRWLSLGLRRAFGMP
jgi:Zn-dependent protease